MGKTSWKQWNIYLHFPPVDRKKNYTGSRNVAICRPSWHCLL